MVVYLQPQMKSDAKAMLEIICRKIIEFNNQLILNGLYFDRPRSSIG